MNQIFICLLFQFISFNSLVAQPAMRILGQDDMSFLEGITKAVIDSSRILPGVAVTPTSGPNNTGGTLIRPGGRNAYPAFWIRDYAMSLETGFITKQEQKHMLLLTAATQCDQTWITSGGSMVPTGSIADHVRIDDSLPIYFPGTYSFEEQGNQEYGMTPPYCDQFFFIHMAYYYVKTTSDLAILSRDVNDMKLLERLELAFKMPPSGHDNIVFTTEAFRGVDFGFRDAIKITGYLSFSSILKYRAAMQMAELMEKLHKINKAGKYKQIAKDIKRALPKLFLNEQGMLRASTGWSSQPDVWATALAAYFSILEGAELTKACVALADAYQQGTMAYKGNIRHVLTTDFYNGSTAWEKAGVDKNTYQNGAYWGTPAGWVCYAIAKVNPSLAQKLAREFIAELKENDFRKGMTFGAPYECFYPPAYKQNPVYMTSVACPYAVFRSWPDHP